MLKFIVALLFVFGLIKPLTADDTDALVKALIKKTEPELIKKIIKANGDIELIYATGGIKEESDKPVLKKDVIVKTRTQACACGPNCDCVDCQCKPGMKCNGDSCKIIKPSATVMIQGKVYDVIKTDPASLQALSQYSPTFVNEQRQPIMPPPWYIGSFTPPVQNVPIYNQPVQMVRSSGG